METGKKMNIAVVIPTYNERDNIGSLISQILGLNIPGLEIIIVDDNSPDGTGRIVAELEKENPKVHLILRPRKISFASAIITGFQWALKEESDYIFEMDADFSHDPQMLPAFLEKIAVYDIVIGSRYQYGTRVRNWPAKRRALSFLANMFIKKVTRMRLTDNTSGFKCVRRSVLEALDLNRFFSRGFAFLFELNYRAYQKGFSLTEVPITFVNRNHGKSKMSFQNIFEAFMVTCKLKVESFKNACPK
jgi:dolichol-phosphate mannosyltransferase